MTKLTTHPYQLRSINKVQEETVTPVKKTKQTRKKRAPPRRRGQPPKTKKVTFATTPPPLRRVDSYGTLSSCSSLPASEDGNGDVTPSDPVPAPTPEPALAPAPLGRYDTWGTLSTLTTLPETEYTCTIASAPSMVLPDIPRTPSQHGETHSASIFGAPDKRAHYDRGDAKGMWGVIDYWRVQVAETSQRSRSEVRRSTRGKGKGKQRADVDVEMSEIAETEAPYEEDTLNEYSLDKGDADIPARVSPPAELDVPMDDGLRTPPRPLDWEDTLIIDTSTPTLDKWRRNQFGRSRKPVVFPVICGTINNDAEHSYSGETEIIEN